MIDLLENSRQQMIENLQISLRAIRNLMGFSAQELGDFIGVTRQTINNLETGKSKMIPIQYVSLSAVIDNYVAAHDEMLVAIETIIDGNGKKQNKDYVSSFHNSSLLKRWFACFGEFNDIRLALGDSAYETDYNTLLTNLISGYKVFIAADALMSENVDTFICAFGDRLYTERARVIIPLRVVEQIQQLLTVVGESSRAVKALKIINDMQRRGIVELRGEIGDTNPQDTILSVFAKFRSTHRLCLVTQDEVFAAEITGLNVTSDKQGFDIIAGYIDGGGVFRLFDGTGLTEAKTKNSAVENIGSGNEDVFAPTDIIDTDENSIEVSLRGWEQI